MEYISQVNIKIYAPRGKHDELYWTIDEENWWKKQKIVMTQDEVLAILKTGAHVFLTGEAGSGKTHTINRYTDYLREHEIVGIEIGRAHV